MLGAKRVFREACQNGIESNMMSPLDMHRVWHLEAGGRGSDAAQVAELIPKAGHDREAALILRRFRNSSGGVLHKNV